MANRIFPKYEREEEQQFSLPNGPTLAVRRMIDPNEAHVIAILASPKDEDPPHLLALTAERVEKGFFLHSIEHLDHPESHPKLRIATVNGETRIYIRVGGPKSEQLIFVTLEQLEWLMLFANHIENEGGEQPG